MFAVDPGAMEIHAEFEESWLSVLCSVDCAAVPTGAPRCAFSSELGTDTQAVFWTKGMLVYALVTEPSLNYQMIFFLPCMYTCRFLAWLPSICSVLCNEITPWHSSILLLCLGWAVLLCLDCVYCYPKVFPFFNASEPLGLVLQGLSPMSNPLSTEINGIPCVNKNYGSE